MAELADALDLGSSAARRGGSTPSTRTITLLVGSIMVMQLVLVQSTVGSSPTLPAKNNIRSVAQAVA